jgi:hypothetical protein
MKIHVFPSSGSVVGIVALKNCLALDCELKPIDLAGPPFSSRARASITPALELAIAAEPSSSTSCRSRRG